MVICRFVHFCAVLLMFGGCAFRPLLLGAWPAGGIDRALRTVNRGLAWVALGSGLVWLLLTTHSMAGSWPETLDPATLWLVYGVVALVMLLALVGGSLTAMLSAVFVGHWLGGSLPTLLSLAPKSVTTPIAMGIAERIGGHPSLAAVMVIATGILGAITAQTIFRWLKVNDDAVSGFALGVAAHGIGTARAFQLSETMGAFAALGMGLNGLLTAISLPSLIQWLKPWLQ